jgi:hypothetical protein
MGGPPSLDILPRRIGQQHRQKNEQHEHGGRRSSSEQAALEHQVIDDKRWKLRRDSRPAIGERADEVEGRNGELQLDDDGSYDDRPKRRQNDAPVHSDRSGAVDLRGLDQVGIDGPKAGEEERHGEARGLPDRSDNDRPDCHVTVDQPVEPEGSPAEVVDELLDSEARIEQPTPDRAGDDERHRQGVEEDGSQHVLAANALIEQDR